MQTPPQKKQQILLFVHNTKLRHDPRHNHRWDKENVIHPMKSHHRWPPSPSHLMLRGFLHVITKRHHEAAGDPKPWLVVSTHLKILVKLEIFPQIGVKIKNCLKPPARNVLLIGDIQFLLWDLYYKNLKKTIYI